VLDRRLIREQPDVVRAALASRRSDVDFDAIVRLEERRRELLEVENLRAQKNDLSKQVGQAMKSGGDAEGLKAKVVALNERIAAMDDELATTESELDARCLEVPNIPLPAVPVGASEEDNVIVKSWSEPRKFDFAPLPHWEIGPALGILNFEAAVKIAGARFIVTAGLGARLERSLLNFMLDKHTREHGYTEIFPPFLANEASLIGTGNLPKFEADLFRTREGLYLVPTAEVPLTNLHQGEILDEAGLPMYYAAYTPCFRSEAGAAGRESRGMVRVHQFHKVELMKYVTPEQADVELEGLTCNAEAILEALDIPYRRVALCTGDMGFGSAQTFDLEVWMPGMDRWLEISSCSQYTDFQARRCNTRYRPADGSKPRFVNTMNGSGLAIGRTFAAILENYQTAEGTVVVPEALRPYMGVPEINPPLP
jgi:seryl-tRNA synthetase